MQTLSPRQRIAIVIVVELLYWFGTRYILSLFAWDTYLAEALRTLLRAVTAAADWWLLRDLVPGRVPRVRAFRSVSILFSVVLLMLAAGIFIHPVLPSGFALFFAISAIFVGIKEEILFRRFLFNALEARIGLFKSVLIVNIVFTAWHAGVAPHSAESYAAIFLPGLALTLLYARTGSLLAVITLHAAYDAIFSLPSLPARRAPDQLGVVLLVVAVGFMCYTANASAKRTRESA
jgi:membrane protease YdiL (CAAX protease family)